MGPVEDKTMMTDEAAKIFSEIETGPPLMRARARAAYLGKEIDWTAAFFSGDPEDEQRAFLAFRHEPSQKMIFVRVALADYPWLQSAQRGERVRLHGRISDVGSLTIDLEAVRLVQVAEAAH